MDNPNNHYLFHTGYYEKLALLEGGNPAADFEVKLNKVKANDDHIKLCTEALTGWTYSQKPRAGDKAFSQRFCMETAYPGLLLGLGSPHASNSTQSETPEVILGFGFDYVTGLPVIPASSVKGALRAPFVSHPDYVLACLGWEDSGDTRVQLKWLEYGIFGGFHPADRSKAAKAVKGTLEKAAKNKEKAGEILRDKPAKGCGDIFFDAEPVKTAKGGRLLGLENITPHINKENPELSGLTEPTPITLLKVLPKTVFEFRFRLGDTAIDGLSVGAQQKAELFKTLLADLGIGAKTNTGFGVMNACADIGDFILEPVANSSSAQAQRQPAPSAPAQRQGGPAGQRVNSGSGRELHDAVCSSCGKAAKVPFIPDPDRPVYCWECNEKRKKPGAGR